MAHTAPSTEVMKSTLRDTISLMAAWMRCMYSQYSQNVVGCELVGSLKSVDEVGLIYLVS